MYAFGLLESWIIRNWFKPSDIIETPIKDVSSCIENLRCSLPSLWLGWNMSTHILFPSTTYKSSLNVLRY